MDQPNASILERNLAALALRSPIAAKHIRGATPSPQVEFAAAPDGNIVGVLDGRALCSKRNPLAEASTWAKQYDPQHCGYLGILGFAMGYHIQALFESHSNQSVLLCYEPDAALLRAVFERIDHSDWIRKSLFLLTTEPRNAPALTQLIEGSEVFLSTGVELAAHPPSTKRLGDSANEFSSTLLDVVKACRTHLVTVLANSGITLRNILMNAGPYASSSGITPLKDSCTGKTAILIAAGPSLQRNLHLLEDPTIRDRCVIIAVQTMLKPLLERGIKPHFVTALDHHEISKRFYEGLTAEDVQGVRLVVEPKANAAIVQAFPGEQLYATEKQLDTLLGTDLSRDMGKLPAGATVAHLNYYLARYLGCSTTILIGQDLGFTDGQYYASGAAIHQVWAGELSEHRTLEMFEWERIARMKNLLRLKRDIENRPIFTDEQMSTYIAQFESDFHEDTQKNTDGSSPIRIINATEGGVRIEHTESMTLANAIKECIAQDTFEIPPTHNHAIEDDGRIIRVCSRLELVLRQLDSIFKNCEITLALIKDAQNNAHDPSAFDRVISKIHTIRDEVAASEPAFALVNAFNQRCALDRFRVDRTIMLQSDLSNIERQIQQLERDANNVRWIKESTKQVRVLIERSLGVVNGTHQPITRDEPVEEFASSIVETPVHTVRVEAVIFADPDVGPLGVPRDLSRPIYSGHNALELTIKRLASCQQIDGITIITPDAMNIESMNIKHGSLNIRVVQANAETLRNRTRTIAHTRIASSECWRGSIASTSCYDESLHPEILASVMDEHRIEACAIVGSDWAMIDPTLVDQTVKLHRDNPESFPIVFSQAVPGLGCCVLARSSVEALASSAAQGSPLASIGAMLSYIPIAPQGDPIASPLCVSIDPAIRDAGVRVVADSTVRAQAMAAAYRGMGEYAMDSNSAVLIKAFNHELEERLERLPSRVQIELTSERNAQGLWASMHIDGTGHSMPTDRACELMDQIRLANEHCSLLIAGRGDPLLHENAMDIINHASSLDFASIELRTDLINIKHTAESIIQSGIDVLSVDVLANTPSVYQQMIGSNNFEGLLDTMQSLFNARQRVEQSTPWIVPRITRCDTAYADIQGFYDRWLTVCGCAVIDPNPNPDPSERIQPLKIPDHRASQLERNTLRIQADGQVIDHLGRAVPNTNAIELGIERAYQNYRAFLKSESDACIEPKQTQQLVSTQ